MLDVSSRQSPGEAHIRSDEHFPAKSFLYFFLLPSSLFSSGANTESLLVKKVAEGTYLAP